MHKAIFFILLTSTFALYSCKVDNICASYQSYYLLSPTPQPSAFSYQKEDSLPNHETPALFALVSEDGKPRKDLPHTEKDKNGLVKSEWNLVKNWNKRIVPKEVIMPEIADSVLFRGDDIMYAEREVVDSVALDSARSAVQSFKYNNDQKFYNWYFRDKLVWQDEQGGQPQNSQDNNPNQVPVKQEEPKQEKKKLFQNLFNKKDKSEDSQNETVPNN
jgi:hypothetical protein